VGVSRNRDAGLKFEDKFPLVWLMQEGPQTTTVQRRAVHVVNIFSVNFDCALANYIARTNSLKYTHISKPVHFTYLTCPNIRQNIH
jgi:hypothetical protein